MAIAPWWKDAILVLFPAVVAMFLLQADSD